MKKRKQYSAIERRAMRRHRDIVKALDHISVVLSLIACLLEDTGDEPDPGEEQPISMLRVVK